jgi:sugar lactone lactonase YvrE
MPVPTWRALPGPRHELAEEPTRLDDGLLYVDVPRGEIWRRALAATARPVLSYRLEAPISAARPDGTGGLVVATGTRLVRLRDGRETTLARLPYDPVRWQVNGLVLLRDGRVLAGLLSRDRSEVGTLVLVDGAATRVVLPAVRAANGLCLDDTGLGGWQVDTYARTLTRFAVRGTEFDARVVATVGDLPGRPDGIGAAAAGGVWVAMWDGGVVARLDAAGKVTDVLPAPVARPTCPLQLGPHLYVTTARADDGTGGHLYRIPVA